MRVSPLLISLAAAHLVLLAGCGGDGGGNSTPSRAITAPSTVTAGAALQWSVELDADERASTTVFDANNTVVYARAAEGESTFEWTPFDEGQYLILVHVDDENGPAAEGQTLVTVAPRGGPSVTGTAHPLVALYTYIIPDNREGNVTYTCDSCTGVVARTFETPRRAGDGAEKGVLLPALRPSSTYTVRHTIYANGEIEERGPELPYTTGPIPVALPTVDILSAPVNPGINALLAIATLRNVPQIVDENATPVWYMANGDMLLRPTGSGWTLLRNRTECIEIDYTGQSLRSATLAAINAQLDARGYPRTLNLHHEMRPLPDRRFALFGSREKLVTDQQGPGTVDVVGDTVIVLDDQMQVAWIWDSFDHLDITRMAQLGNVYVDGGDPDLQLAGVANDWTHMNSIDYDPADGNLILSVRHLSWVVKIAYEDGRGDGHVVWRLGDEGDFTLTATDPDPWFTYQHDANILPDGRLAVYDNGNVRVSENGGNSRGQVYILDEVSRQAVLDVNIDLGIYSSFLGSAGLAPDNSYHFNSGAVALHDTVDADGFLHSSFQSTGQIAYRSFRMSDPFDTGPN